MNKLANQVRPSFRFDRAPKPSAWCEDHLTIPPQMSPRSHGKLSLRSTPWARPILDCWDPESGVRRCNVAIAVQMLKTFLMVLGVSYRMNFSPVPQMLVGGMSEKFARREISEKRLHPLINANPILSALKPHDPHQFRLLEMAMAYAPILVTGAGSDTNLAGSTQGIVAIGEASKIERQTSEQAQEAHPIRLAEDRTKDYIGQEFIWKDSTPNSPNHIFWQDVEAGTFTHFYVPCPHCREYFKFEFESKNGDKLLTPGELERTAMEGQPDLYRSLVWSPLARNADGTWSEKKVRETAHYVCPHCGGPIRDADKPAMLAAYEEKHENEKAAMSDRSFRVPAFYKPTRTFADLAWAFLDRGDLFNTGMQVMFNHEFALPWEDIDVNVKDEDVESCKATGDLAYQRGTLPPVSGGMLVAGADWGEKMTHWAVCLIDPQGNVWVIDWGTVAGLGDLMTERKRWVYSRPGCTKKKTPRFGVIDSGENAMEIYKMCRRSRFWLPTKGSDAASGTWHVSNLKSFPGLQLHVYVDKALKDDLYDARIKRKTDPRFFLPTNATVDVLHGLSGQKRLDKGVRAAWRKVKHDHYGDAIKECVFASWLTAAERFAA